jgi:sec-independent protein translocase protein TatA
MNVVLNTLLFLGSLGPSELIIIALIVLLLFGGKKIPELMRGMGKGIREFNNAKDGMRDEIRKGMNDDETSSSNKEN